MIFVLADSLNNILPTHLTALPQVSASEPSELKIMILKSAILSLQLSIKIN